MGGLRWLTAGESHGPALVATLEGLPAGVNVSGADLSVELARRRLGYGRGARMQFEQDRVEILGGLRHGVSQGGPFAVVVHNTEWPKWRDVMAPEPFDESGQRYDSPGYFDETARANALTRPRPGHADLVGMQKYGFDDARPVLERASARETAARVALGAVAQAFLQQVAGIRLISHTLSLGHVEVPPGTALPDPATDRARIDADPLRCADPATSALMVTEIEAAKKAGDTLGGIVEVVVTGLPPGLGSHVHGDRRLDARLAGAVMGIQAIKGVEMGDGFTQARSWGSEAHDEIEIGPDGLIRRRTGRAGGTEGGMSSGEVLRIRAAMKPIATLSRALDTVDVATMEAAKAIAQRSDVCAVPAAGVVVEAMVALVLADAMVEKFGGDSVTETARNLHAYLDGLAVR